MVEELSEKEPDISLLFFEEEYEDVPITIDEHVFTFTIRGLNREECEECAAQAHIGSTEQDAQGRSQIRVDPSKLHHELLKRGVVRTPPGMKWDDATIRKLKGHARDILLDAIRERSDGIAFYKKKSGISSPETPTTPELPDSSKSIA